MPFNIGRIRERERGEKTHKLTDALIGRERDTIRNTDILTINLGEPRDINLLIRLNEISTESNERSKLKLTAPDRGTDSSIVALKGTVRIPRNAPKLNIELTPAPLRPLHGDNSIGSGETLQIAVLIAIDFRAVNREIKMASDDRIKIILIIIGEVFFDNSVLEINDVNATLERASTVESDRITTAHNKKRIVVFIGNDRAMNALPLKILKEAEYRPRLQLKIPRLVAHIGSDIFGNALRFEDFGERETVKLRTTLTGQFQIAELISKSL